MIDKLKAIQSLRPDAEFVIRGEVVEWVDTKQTQPTEEEIQAEIVRLQAEYDANQYQRDRVYPSIQDQLDMQYWDKVNGTTTWQDAIAKVKTDTPKPGE
jgi:FKBP-type peptidyl-prolyl cis-trans isomerase (trigger factor)